MKTQPKIKPKKSTIIYEINDEGREHEFSGGKYRASFVELLKSLGYKITYQEPLSTITINDIEFNLYDKNASYMCQNAYNRQKSIRKPANRFMALQKYDGRQDVLIKVHINKEIEKNKLKEKINKAIDIDLQRAQEVNKRSNIDKLNTIEISNHIFGSSELMKQFITTIRIHQSKIELSLKCHASIVLNPDFEFIQFSCHYRDCNSLTDLQNLYTSINETEKQTDYVLATVCSLKKLSNQLKEWANGAYERRFNVEKMEYWEY